MGLEYEYGLCFRYEELYELLEDLGQNAKVVADRKVDIIFPDYRITLPFTSNFKSEPIHIDDSTRSISLDTSLYFKPDDEIEMYLKEQEEYLRGRGGDWADYRSPRDDQGRVAIGYIYLYISFELNDPSLFIYFLMNTR